jgi:putative transposase
VVVPGLAHHVTQRGNRREPIFFEPGDPAVYLDLLGEQLRRRGVACWSYCLMPNHVHLILVPSDERGLALALGEAHRRYTGFVGARARWTGHLFQGRFGSVAMDEAHLLAAFRYLALNPVKAGLVASAEAWPWSSTRALIAGRSDAHVEVGPALERTGPFAAFLAGADRDGEGKARWVRLLSAEAVGRPVGAEDWIKGLEARLGVPLTPQKRGPKPKRDRA